MLILNACGLQIRPSGNMNNMKATKFFLFVIIIFVCISCVSSKGYIYYRWDNVSLSIVYHDDSTLVMYYANALPVAKIHYDVDKKIHHDRIHYDNHSIYVSNVLGCTVKTIDILDNTIYDYLNKEISRKYKTREHIICEGNQITIYNHKYLLFSYDNNKNQDCLLFYSKPYLKKLNRSPRRRVSRK